MALRVGTIFPERSTNPSVTTGATISGMPSARDAAWDALRAVTKGQKRTETVPAPSLCRNNACTDDFGRQPVLSASLGSSINRFRSAFRKVPSPRAPSAKDARQYRRTLERDAAIWDHR